MEILTTILLLLLPIIVRKVNSELEKWRRLWRWDDMQLSEKMSIEPERYRNHIINDSSNSWMIATAAKALGLPTLHPDLFADGEIVRRFKRRIAEKGWKAPAYAKRLWPEMKDTLLPIYAERLRKHLEAERADAYFVAVQCEFWDEPTMPSPWFLNKRDLVELRGGLKDCRQLELI